LEIQAEVEAGFSMRNSIMNKTSQKTGFFDNQNFVLFFKNI